MAYPTPKDLAAIALSALTGAGIAVSFLAGESGSDALSIVVFAITMILCPSIAGYLSTRNLAGKWFESPSIYNWGQQA